MNGEWKKDTKVMKLNTTAEVNTWRQVLTKEQALQKKKTDKELEAMAGTMYKKNTYLHLFKHSDKLKKETMAEKTGKNIIFVYDQVMRDQAEREKYCQKCQRESVWCKDRVCRELPKVKNSSMVQSSQAYGWRPPIDNLQTGFARNAVCKHTFVDTGHL